MSSAKQNWIRWCKFNAVGAMGIVVQLVALTLLKSGLHLNYLVATALAVEAAVIHNFFWHERYTWADRESTSRLIRFAKFNLSNGVISILGNIALMRLLVGAIGLNYFVANALSIAGCSLLNFVVSDRLVFTGQTQSMCRCRSTDQMSSEFFSNG
ncbi:MAG TPA: GtrA family protein [Terriglobales bacterium]|jgi:putative flippase GtrA|nr:GtrA family protein [Terriglobales bacterium]